MKNKHPCKAKNLSIALGMVLLNALVAIPATHAAMVAKCNQYDTVNITPTSNTYKVHNDVEYSDDNSQCIKVDDATGSFSVITSETNFPSNGVSASSAFIGKGCHWGACTSTTQSGMPKKVISLLNATSSWKTTQPAKGVYNVSYDLWFNKTATTNIEPDGANIAIWLAYKGDIRPVGVKVQSNVSIAGSQWNVWKGLDNGVNVMTYVRATSVASVSNLNLKAFVSDAATRNVIQANWYLIAVDAGFEIWQSSEGLASSGFSALIE